MRKKSNIDESKLFIQPLQCNVVYDVNNPKKGYVIGTAVIRETTRTSQQRLLHLSELFICNAANAKIHRLTIFL